MKKSVFSIVIFMMTIGAFSQNLQVHYDMGKGNNYVTTTFEMFKPDAYGNTFAFVDMDYNSNGAKGVTLAYWEIARVFKTAKMPVGVQVEYNGGMFRTGGTFHKEIESAWLAGIDYSMNAPDYSKGFSIKALFKHIVNKHDASFQLTGVWYMHLLDGQFTFNGFMDFWKEDNMFLDGSKTKFVFVSQPQIWYNITKHLSAGSEVEIGNNFGGVKGWKVNPTIAVKYNF